MNLLSVIAAFVAIQHVGFFVLESFFWTKPLGLRVFAQKIERAHVSRVLAFNQGFYNLILALGLVWGILHPSAEVGHQILTFFFASVVLAGIVGGLSVSCKILFIQALPAAVGLVLALPF